MGVETLAVHSAFSIPGVRTVDREDRKRSIAISLQLNADLYPSHPKYSSSLCNGLKFI